MIPDGDDCMQGFRFNLEEFSGSVGNFGTVLPFALGVALVSPVSLGAILFFFGLWYILAGIIYRIPIPIEPMKAIGAIVIAEGIGSGEIAASGILCGILFLAIGIFRGMDAIREYIPRSVIRGIQLGLALILLRTSLSFIVEDLLFSAVGIAIILLFFILTARWSIPDISALIVIIIGIGTAIVTFGFPPVHFPVFPGLVIPSVADFMNAGWRLVLPQIPLTLANAILATSLLAHDLYHREIPPDNLAKTIGIMNLISAPFGGFPMCHGAGGLAAHYRFGARSGTALVVGGIILLLTAFLFSTPETISVLPLGMFGSLLVFIALELGKHGLKTDDLPITVGMALIALFSGMTAAFIIGILAVYLLRSLRKGSGKMSEKEG